MGETHLDPWLRSFLKEAEQDTEVLRQLGLEEMVRAREQLLAQLLRHATAAGEQFLTAKEAAELLGCHPRTIHRMLERGQLPDARSEEEKKARRPARIRRADLNPLRSRAAPSSDRTDDALTRVLGFITSKER